MRTLNKIQSESQYISRRQVESRIISMASVGVHSKAAFFTDIFEGGETDVGFNCPGVSSNIESHLAAFDHPPISPCSEEAVDLVSASCWKLKTIHRTLTGGFLSSDVLVPLNSFLQPGTRLIGLSLKIEMLEALSSKLVFFTGDTRGFPLPTRDSPHAVLVQALESLNSFCVEITTLHDRLHRSFPSLVAERVTLHGSVNPDSVTEEMVGQEMGLPRKDEVKRPPNVPSEGAPAARLWGVAGVWGAAASKAAVAVGRTAVAIGRSAAEASTEIASVAGMTLFCVPQCFSNSLFITLVPGKTALSAYERAKNVLPVSVF